MQYAIDRSEALAGLAGLIGAAHVLTGEDAACFEQEWRAQLRGHALAVARPGNTAEVAAVMRFCAARGIAVVPQGGNTGLAAGAIPDASGTQLVLNLCRMDRIRHIDLRSLTATVEAGCTLQRLRETLAAQQMQFPLSLGSEGSCTLGGNLATNAGGAQVLRHGNARDLCLGLEYVTAQGEIVSELGGLRKDNTGLDLRNLLIGSEGCLAVITAATVTFVDAPTATATAWCAVADMDAALQLLRACQAGLGHALGSFEVMNRLSLEMVERQFPDHKVALLEQCDASYFVLLQADDTGSEAELMARVAHVLELALEAGALLDAAIGDSHQRSRQFWQFRENIVMAQARITGVVNFDISLPLSAIPAFLREAADSMAQRWGPLPVVNFGHLGDGNLHYSVHTADAGGKWPCPSESQLRDVVYDLVAAANGSFSAEHGIGAAKTQYLARYKAGPRHRMMQAIKAALDPQGILNPGKLLPDLSTGHASHQCSTTKEST